MSTPSRPTSRTAGYAADEHDPIPISVFLDHTDWFREQKNLDVEEILVESLARADDGFVAEMNDGSTIAAEKVLAAPGIAHFVQLPEWYAEVPADRRSHTSERVTFDDLAGARVAIIGGRQSAYEWAALLCDHGAARVDVIHRHDTPRFEKVSWAFVNPYVEQTLAAPRLVARPAGGAPAGDRAGVLAGRAADARALADAPAGSRRRPVAAPDPGHGRRRHRPRRRPPRALGR